MKKPSILCVDDEKIVLNSLKEQLKTKLGTDYNIELAESGEDALEIIEELSENQIDIPLVISDYIMPGMKGDELLTAVHEMNPNIINILLTGQATLNGVVNAINNAGLYRYITKPWETEDLNMAVSEALKSYSKDRKIENQNMLLSVQNEELIVWREAFVEAMGTLLDTRDTTTAGHSKRIANYAVKTAYAVNRINYGQYASFSFTEDQIKELQYSALLHDIGKIGVREQILLKQQRITLERQMTVMYRMYWYIEVLKTKQKNGTATETDDKLLSLIPGYIKFIAAVNKKEILSDEDLDKIKEIADYMIIDFDGKEKHLLDDFEVENLSVKSGNLTTSEREKIKSHAKQTYNILKSIPWPEKLKNIPEIAASHHERLNGTGYFRGLCGDAICVQSRILAILDIFEALTSPDRPYKEKKTVDEALAIISREVNEGFLDKDLFEIFVNEKIYQS